MYRYRIFRPKAGRTALNCADSRPWAGSPTMNPSEFLGSADPRRATPERLRPTCNAVLSLPGSQLGSPLIHDFWKP